MIDRGAITKTRDQESDTTKQCSINTAAAGYRRACTAGPGYQSESAGGSTFPTPCPANTASPPVSDIITDFVPVAGYYAGCAGREPSLPPPTHALTVRGSVRGTACQCASALIRHCCRPQARSESDSDAKPDPRSTRYTAN